MYKNSYNIEPFSPLDGCWWRADCVVPPPPASPPTIAENIIENTTITQAKLDILNEQINNAITQTTLNTAATCSTTSINSQDNTVTLGNITNSTIKDSSTQAQTSKIDFSCVQAQAIIGKTQTDVVNTMVNALKNNFSAESLAKMAARAEVDTQTVAGAPPSGASANAINIAKTINKTDINQRLVDSLINNVTSNMNQETVASCISRAQNIQNSALKAENVSGSEIDLSKSQTQVSSSFVNCMQEQSLGSEIINSSMKSLGITIDKNSSTKNQTTQDSSSSLKEKQIPASSYTWIWWVLGIILILCICAGVGYFLYTYSQEDMDSSGDMMGGPGAPGQFAQAPAPGQFQAQAPPSFQTQPQFQPPPSFQTQPKFQPQFQPRYQ